MAPNEFLGGGAALFMIVPFLFIGVGLAYLSIAAGDKRGRRQSRQVRVLPVGAQHPLSHVRSKMKPAPASVPRRPEEKPAPRRRSEPPWLTGV
jgi:hypothetical protein